MEMLTINPINSIDSIPKDDKVKYSQEEIIQLSEIKIKEKALIEKYKLLYNINESLKKSTEKFPVNGSTFIDFYMHKFDPIYVGKKIKVLKYPMLSYYIDDVVKELEENNYIVNMSDDGIKIIWKK